MHILYLRQRRTRDCGVKRQGFGGLVVHMDDEVSRMISIRRY